jgi:hypothetical protein
MWKTKEQHHNWKGENVSYKGLHTWISNNYGKPMKCEDCGITGLNRYHWANKSGEYKREREDWMRLCPTCHYDYDYTRIRRNNPNVKWLDYPIEI